MSGRETWPIVIGGCHRSGTSLLRRVLDAHSRIHCGPEVKFFLDFHDGYLRDPARHARFLTSARAILPEEDLLEVLGGAFVALHERAAARAGKPRWADKCPENAVYLGDWQRLLGDRWLFVHAVRNPLDTLASIKEARFPFAIPESLDARIEHYSRYLEAGLAFAAAHPERSRLVLYEELTGEPERVLTGLHDFFGERFEPRQILFNEAPHQDGLEDPKVKGEREVHQRSVGRWRELLTPDEAREIARRCGDLWKRVDRDERFPLPAPVPAPAARPSARPPAPFLVGSGRCGTTLLRLMLDSHPELAIPPETHFIPEVAARCAAAGQDGRAAFLETITSQPSWPDFHLDRQDLACRLQALEPFHAGDGLRAFYQLYAGRFGKARWGDKTPLYGSRMPLIQRLLPEARFVHLIRDGRDVALSFRELWFGPRSLREAAEWWASKVAAARRDGASLPHYLELRYEDLVREPEASLRRVCDFLELPWRSEMLDYHRSAAERLEELASDARAADGHTVAAQERRGIHALTAEAPRATRVARWKSEMSQDDVRWFETASGRLLAELGYELSGPVPEAEQPLWERRVASARDELARVVPPRARVALVDEDQWGLRPEEGGPRFVPFPERDGLYWGLPPDDASAVRELERQRSEGMDFVAFAWSSFWWLDHFAGLARHLRARYRCVLDNERLVVFDLRG